MAPPLAGGAEFAMNRPPVDPKTRRANIGLAIILGLVALGIMVGFMWL